MLTTHAAAEWIPVAAETELSEPASYVLAEVAGQRAIVVRGRDGVVRALEAAASGR